MVQNQSRPHQKQNKQKSSFFLLLLCHFSGLPDLVFFFCVFFLPVCFGFFFWYVHGFLRWLEVFSKVPKIFPCWTCHLIKPPSPLATIGIYLENHSRLRVCKITCDHARALPCTFGFPSAAGRESLCVWGAVLILLCMWAPYHFFIFMCGVCQR